MTIEEIRAEMARIAAQYDPILGPEIHIYPAGEVAFYVDGVRQGRGFTFREAFDQADLEKI